MKTKPIIITYEEMQSKYPKEVRVLLWEALCEHMGFDPACTLQITVNNAGNRREPADTIGKARLIAIDGIKRATDVEDGQGDLLFLLGVLGEWEVVKLFLDKFCADKTVDPDKTSASSQCPCGSSSASQCDQCQDTGTADPKNSW